MTGCKLKTALQFSSSWILSLLPMLLFGYSVAEERKDFAPKISPDGQEIAFYGYTNGSPDLYVISVDGSHERRLTNTPEYWEILPQWSPDGERLFYTGGERLGRHIYSIRSDGSDNRIETVPPPQARDLDAALASRSNQFAFLRHYETGRREIVLRQPNARNERILLAHSIENLHISRLSMDPDGKRLLFTANLGVKDPPYPTNVYVMEILTGHAAQVTFDSSEWKRQATFSRDGRSILYSADKLGSFDIYRIPSEGGEPIQLTFFANTLELFSDLRDDLLVFDAGHYPDGEMCIYAAAADGSNVRRLTGECDFRSTSESQDSTAVKH